MGARARSGLFALLCTIASLAAPPALAVLPPLTDHTVTVAGKPAGVLVPVDWGVEATANGLTMQRDAGADLFGTAMLEFHQYEAAPTPDAFLSDALDRLGKPFAQFEVVETTAPAERPRVRLAQVRFSRHGFVCNGYVMAVIGRETGTIGFAWAEAVTARRLELEDLVALLVAGTYDSFPVRQVGKSPGQEAHEQALEELFGDATPDLRAALGELDQAGGLDLALLGRCGMFQPLLRTLKGFLTEYLSDREKERIEQAQIYCIPSRDFNAFALGRNDLGPGFLAFFAGMCDPFARAAEHYCGLREQGLGAAELSGRLTAYSEQLAVAVLAQQPLPEPEGIDWADQEQVDRFIKVFNGMIGTVLAHEMAHYYMRHSESGQTNDPHSVQQREVAADTAALRHLQHVADETSDFWEGGIIHCFGFFATLDNIMKAATGGGQMPEYMQTHPFGETRLNMAAAAVGQDDLHMRHDPWNHSTQLEHGEGGVQVVGGLGLTPPAGPGPGVPPIGAGGAPVFQHPVSGVTFTIPAGWVGMFDPTSGMMTLCRQGRDGQLPLIAYSTGGQYPDAKAVVEDIIRSVEANAGPLERLKDEAVPTDSPALRVHGIVARGTLGIGPATVFAVGALAGDTAHGLLMLTAEPEADSPVLVELLNGMRFP